MFRAGSIGAKFLAKMMMSAVSTNTASGLKSSVRNLRMLRDTLQECGGVFAKVAQILSYDSPNAEVFDECRSKLSAPTHTAFVQGNFPFQVDTTILKSGSLSQLYAGWLNGTKLALKVQYIGLAELCEEDLHALKLLGALLYSSTPTMASAMDEITIKIREELDYLLEARSQEWFASISRVRIPKVYAALSTRTMLVTEYVDGQDFASFIATASNERKQAVGDELCHFIFESLWIHHALYSDTHFGNLLVDNQGKLVVLDFGCVHHYDDELIGIIKRIWDDPSIATLVAVGILPANLTGEEELYAVNYFRKQLEPWKTPGFVFTPAWLDDVTDRDQSMMSNWVMPQGVVYLNKVVYGLYHVLTALGANGVYWPTTDHVKPS